MNLLQSFSCHMGIYLSRRDIDMAEHHLDRTKVRSPFQKMASKGVTEKMRGDPFPNPRPLTIGFGISPEPLSAHIFPRAVDKKKRALLPFRKTFSSGLQIEMDPLHGFH